MKQEMTIQEAYEAGRRIGKGDGHNHSAPETLEKIACLDKNLALNKLSMDNLTQKVDDGFSENRQQHKEIMEAFKEAVSGKADKYIEKVVIYGGGVLIAVMVASLGFLIKITLFK